MDPIRDLVDTLGITPTTFDYLIILTIVVGSVWAARRLYGDLTSPPHDFWQARQAADDATTPTES